MDVQGFIRLALVTGAHVVPVFGFGTTHSYKVCGTQAYLLRARKCNACERATVKTYVA